MSAETPPHDSRKPLRIAFAIDRREDAEALLPAAERLAARPDVSACVAAIGWQAREILAEIGCEHALPDDTDWFVRANDFDLIVLPLYPADRSGLHRRIAHEASLRGVPSLFVEADPERPAFDADRGERAPLSYLAVTGNESYARALEAGWREERIAVTGQSPVAAMNAMLPSDEERSLEALLDALCAPTAGAVATLAEPPSPAERLEALAFSLASARRARVESALLRVREGNTQLAIGALARAEQAYRDALRIDSANPIALSNLGVVIAERGDASGALEIFDRLFAIDPADETARLTAARVLAQRGQPFEAARHVEEVLAFSPGHRGALLLLAEIYLEAGLPEQALGLYESAAQIEPLGAVHAARRREAASRAGLELAEESRFEQSSSLRRAEPRSERPASFGAHESAASTRAETRDAQAAPRLSIVVVAYNSAADLPDCLDSIARCTRTPHEVIVVDNASTDGTRALLRERRGIALIESDSNAGYSRAANLGIARARGEAVVLLNPDTAVTPGWDDRMLAHAKPGVGAVGPLSNYVAGLQKFEAHVSLPAGQLGIDELARILAARNAGRGVETKLLIGFCLLIAREALDRAGAMDEDLFLGNDDLEYSHRLRRAGLRLVIATDAFVYHKGQRSFASEPSEKTNRLVEESTNRLQEKLEGIYGIGRVPSSQELWGISWFQPTRKRAISGASGSAGTEQKTSIVILTWNELAYTKACVASIQRHTPEAHELIFVDNGSTDGTREWLATVPGAKVIANATNVGFAAGANQGIRAASGERVLLLNNDIIVTEGWLSGLAHHLDADASCGLVGPISNYVSGQQLDESARYDSIPAMEEHARSVRTRSRGRSREVRRLVGFCLLARAEVFRTVGLFDEGYSLGNFEDDDFSMRCVLAGWRLRIAGDVFIHHFGSRTFAGNKIDYRAAMEKNRAYFLEKWRGVVTQQAAAPVAPASNESLIGSRQ
jgi:GT2 family glycosyltransferase/tetratricopeptide (TPR) repeat protein